MVYFGMFHPTPSHIFPFAQEIRPQYLIGSAEHRMLNLAGQQPALSTAFGAHAQAALQTSGAPRTIHKAALSALTLTLAIELRRGYPIGVHDFTLRGLDTLFTASTGRPWPGPQPEPVMDDTPIQLTVHQSVNVIGYGPRQRERHATVVEVSCDHALVQEAGSEPWRYHLNGPRVGIETCGRASLRLIPWPGLSRT